MTDVPMLSVEQTRKRSRPSSPSSEDLFCCLVGSNTPFPVEFSSSLTVARLKERIKATGIQDLREIKASELDLFKVSLLDEGDLTTKVKNEIEGKEPLTPTESLSKIFPDGPPEETIHIVVKPPDNTDLNVSQDVLRRWRDKHRGSPIPNITELRTRMDTPLLENEKIPLSQTRLDELLVTAPNESRDFLILEQANTLFRSSDSEYAGLLERISLTAASTSPPPSDGTKESYHVFWDENIRKVIQIGFVLDNRCPFRGEEKDPMNDDEDPRAELERKLDWDYGSVPYLLGYYCNGTELTYVAIFRPKQGNREPQIQDLYSVDLGTRAGRITNMRWLINLSPLFQDLVDLMPLREPEFIPMERDNCTVELTSRHVIKRYTCSDALERIERLKNIYHWLTEMRVPNTDSVHCISDETIVLQPRGHRELPKTEKELVEAVRCVLQVLKAIHPVLLHRDICWPNVIRSKDDRSKWFLVDWEDAAKAPTKAIPRFVFGSHSPRVLQDGHGGEVDIWGVGHLITESGVISLSSELRRIGLWMKEQSPSVEEAWVKLERYVNCGTQNSARACEESEIPNTLGYASQRQRKKSNPKKDSHALKKQQLQV
ncbi:hypothetical protein K435DRAFT_839132 [Dendrothele bispora CBS 962.96]|uniref:Crinkler effector protein N-terminal domain-containing protein n=1 Tax=Dendrothele bispora (strain CBS 962.96) TaxID=1314807 RepID=A0A4S8M3H2_DENBC|nr:hypothetical protein K435DRAFT_839132 [Dendrothele bispora CBS 962.96]